MFRTLARTNGFTLLELIMTLVILSIVATISIPFATNLYTRSRIDEATSALLETLQRAQSNTAGQRDRGRYSVYLASDRFVYFPGSTYHASSLENEATLMPPAITISWSLNGGGNIVKFNPGDGKTNTYGTVTLTNQTGNTLIVAVDQNGQIYVQ